MPTTLILTLMLLFAMVYPGLLDRVGLLNSSLTSTHQVVHLNLLGAPQIVNLKTTSPKNQISMICSSRYGLTSSAYSDESFTGDIECWLTPGGIPNRTTLLNYDPNDLSPYHTNLGRFLWPEVLGRCWNDPTWGMERTIHVRGAALTLALDNVTASLYDDPITHKRIPVIESADLEIQVKPEDVFTEIASPPAHSEPVSCTE